MIPIKYDYKTNIFFQCVEQKLNLEHFWSEFRTLLECMYKVNVLCLFLITALVTHAYQALCKHFDCIIIKAHQKAANSQIKDSLNVKVVEIVYCV